jgi:hypothetical protein
MAFVPKITINETDEGFVHPYSQTPFATREAMWADLQQHFSPKHDWQRQDIDYVEKGTYGQFVPGAIMNRALSNGEMFRQVQTMPVTANDPRPHRSLELIDYVEDATEGQWGKNDQKWGLIRMGMDARDQERSKQEQDWHGKSEGKPQKPAAGDSTWREWAAERSNGSRGHFDAGHT